MAASPPVLGLVAVPLVRRCGGDLPRGKLTGFKLELDPDDAPSLPRDLDRTFSAAAAGPS